MPDENDTADQLRRALEAHQHGDLATAERLYLGIVQRERHNADALHYFGVLRFQRGDSEGAEALIRAALDVDPAYLSALLNLGNVLKENGRVDEAATFYQRALELAPDEPNAANNLGTVRRAQGRLDEALALYDQALAANPRHPDAHLNRGNLLRQLERLDEAIEAYLHAVELKRWPDIAYRSLGYSLYAVGRVDDALHVFQRWLEISPDHPIARHMVVACSGKDVPARAPDDYIVEYFGRFADSFDEVLGSLGYRAPELVAASVAALEAAPERQFDVLDAGCGTGLCAPLLRPYARRLVGVDLSSAMIDKARARSLYDELVVGELVEALRTRPAAFDLIAAADVLVYFGDLAEVFAAAAAALRPGGRLAFTVEADRDPSAFRIHPHGRYSHGANYLTHALASAGLAVEQIEKETLRKEKGEAVSGFVIRARR